MPQEIYHYSIIELFYQIGLEEGYIPIKEFALANLLKENTMESIDLVWIEKDSGKVNYAFEFETVKANGNKSKQKLIKIDDHIKKYIFYVEKSMNFEKIDTIFQRDEDSLLFLKNLSQRGIKVSFLGKDAEDLYYGK